MHSHRVAVARAILALCSVSTGVMAQVSADSAARLVALGNHARSQAIASPDQLRAAMRYFGSAADAYHGLGDRAKEAGAYLDLAYLFRTGPASASLGKSASDSLLAYGRLAIGILREIGDTIGLARANVSVGEALVLGSSVDTLGRNAAYGYLAEAVAQFRRMGIDSSTARALVSLVHWRQTDIRSFGGRASFRDSTLRYARAADSLAGGAALPLVQSEASRVLGDEFDALGRPDSALVYHYRAVHLSHLAARSDSTETLASLGYLNAIGVDFWHLGLLDSARISFHKVISAPIAGVPPNTPQRFIEQVVARTRAGGLFNLAELFTSYQIRDSAVFYSSRLLEAPFATFFDSVHHPTLLSIAFRRAGRPDSALWYARLALQRVNGRGLWGFQVSALESLGLSFLRLGQVDSSIVYLRRQLIVETNPPGSGGTAEPRARVFINLGAAYQLAGNADSALVYFTRALAGARAGRDRQAEADALARLGVLQRSPLIALAYLDSATTVRRELGLPGLDVSGPPGIDDSEEKVRTDSSGGTRTPLVKIVEARSVSTDSSAFVVAVAASDRGGGIADVRLYDNGTPVATTQRGIGLSAEAIPCAAGAKCFRIRLPPGRHALEAAATARDGKEGERALRLVSVPGRRPAGTMYLLAIGIDEYQNPSYRLRYARMDARAVIDSLRLGSNAAFGRPAIVHELFDLAATHDSIEARLRGIALQAKPEDVFVLYYAGHGHQATIGATTSFFVVPSDVRDMTDPDQLGARGISSARLMELLRDVPARQKIVIIDACQSGGVASAYTWQEPTQGALLQLAIGSGTWIVAASRPQEAAAESAALGHGVFTFALLKALGSDGSGAPREITVAGLLNDVMKSVPTLALRAGTPAQNPVVVGAGGFFTMAIR